MKVGARVRTRNMASMLVTLDVSRFSGWLKASALCRVARGGTYEAGGSSGRDVRGRWAGLRSRMQGRARLEPQGEGTHRKHVFHGCDAGRVEVQRLVEGIRALPSREEVDNTIRDETVDEVRSGGA